LSGALERISHRIRTIGEGAIVEAQFVHVNGYIMLQADVNPYSASRDLTWGVLEEAVVVLQEFTRYRPHPLQVGILEGLNGRGLPLGQMTLRESSMQRGKPLHGTVTPGDHFKIELSQD
ncbi:MAG: hypothetical protein Q9171_006414, partial [Xanthocarpia ochracea]